MAEREKRGWTVPHLPFSIYSYPFPNDVHLPFNSGVKASIGDKVSAITTILAVLA